MQNKTNFDCWHKTNAYFLFYILAGTLMMLLFQLAIIVKYGDFNFLADAKDLSLAFGAGIRSAVKIFATFVILFFLLGTFLWLLPLKVPIKIFSRFIPYAGLISLEMSFFISFINFFYYQPYHKNIDNFIFEAQNETFGDLFFYLKGEFFLPLLFFLLIFGFVVVFYTHRLLQIILLKWSPTQEVTTHRNLKKWKKWYGKTIYAVVLFFFLFVCARGTLDPSTVYRFHRDTEVTPHHLLTTSAINGVASLYVAFEDDKKHKAEKLRTVKIHEALSAFKTLFPKTSVSPESLKEKLYAKTPQLKTKEKPDTVFVLMESWGNHLLKFHNKNTLNMLGNLESHTKEDFFFQNFLSSEQHTFASMQNLLVNFTGIDITLSKYDKISLESAIPNVFKKQGYKTVFITNGGKNWHNLGDYLTSLGFDEIYGWNDLKKSYPKAEINFYGGYEDTVFLSILEKLKNKKEDKPLFIFFLTTSNHSPYFLPKKYKAHPIEKIPTELQKALLTDSNKKTKKVFEAYQYTSNSLGTFISAVKKNHNLKKKVVIAAVGDHYARSVFNYAANESDMFGNFSVPFYLYLPEKYRQNVFFDKNRIGSHRDVFPTIFNNIFSNTKYFASGNNLLSKSHIQTFAINKNFIINEQGAVLIGEKHNFYQWQDKVGGKLEKINSAKFVSLLTAYQKHKAIKQLETWHFQQEIKKPLE